MVARRTSAAYDRIAADYAARNAAMPPNLLDVGARFLARAGPGRHVLDVGCGAGRDMAWLEAQGAEVIGVDLSTGMLAQAQPSVRGRLLRMTMRHLAFRSGHFAGVWCMASLLHLPKAEAPGVLAEIRRVLTPGGVLALGLQEGTGEGWEHGPYPDVERFFARYTAEEAETLLTAARFDVLERRRDDTGARRWRTFLALLPAETSAI